VGLEDNIYYDQKKTKLAKNADLVRRIHTIAEANERQVMTAQELRNALSLEGGCGKYGVRINHG
jgi:uncharacterized protein (DUF849 family)